MVGRIIVALQRLSAPPPPAELKAGPAKRGRQMRSSLHGVRVRRKLSGHRRRAERAIEQRKQHESGDKAAEMSDPGNRHFGEAQRLSSGAENEVRAEPDQNEDERPTLHKDPAEA